MNDAGNAPITVMLRRAAEGDRHSSAEILPLVYDQLRKIAQQRMQQERPGHTLDATALVHEAYLRLTGGDDVEWGSRAHFYVAAAEAMRRILIEHARKRGRQKRGGGRQQVPISVVDLAAAADPEEIVALDDAFRRLEDEDPRAAQVIRLRFYAGLSVEETGLAMGLSRRTVLREWSFARAWLYRELESD